jgi:hypothetical protein
MRIVPFTSAALLTAVLLPQPAPHHFPRTITMDGTLSFADYERLIEREFDVPSGTRRIEVELSYTGADRRTVIDGGLRSPFGLRGWGGGRTGQVIVSALTTTPGYLPGPIEPGRWAVLLGVPNIREGSTDRYTVKISLYDTDRETFAPALRAEPGWYVGDLHAHSFHSDGRGRSQSGAQVPVPIHRVLDEATKAGLDFVLVSDHNTASHWLDVDRLQPYYDRLLLLHGREITTYRGHANTVGEHSFADFRLPQPTASPAGVPKPIADAGAFVSINHPTAPDDERCMGCGWNVADEEMRRTVHGVEVVNGEARGGPLYGWPFWADLLNRGWRLTAVGGSDEHAPDDPGDRNVGVPATVVWAWELSETALVEGLKAGRVYVRTRGPKGPSLEFEAEVSGASHPMGADIPTTSPVPVILRAVLRDAPGQTLEWIRNGQVQGSAVIAASPATVEQSVTATSGDWFSLVVRDAEGPTLLANAVRVGRN